MPRALFIDSKAGTVIETEIPNDDRLSALQKAVDGSIEAATDFPDGDVLYVDEEGLLKDPKYFFDIGAHQPFAGNGIIVGREIDDEGTLADAQTKLTDLKLEFTTVVRPGFSIGKVWKP